MKSAIRAIRGGAKLRPTAALYGIPVMTLSDYSKIDSYDLSIRMGSVRNYPLDSVNTVQILFPFNVLFLI